MPNKIPGKCDVCGYDVTEHPAGGMFKHNRYDKKLAKDYCERGASSHQTVKPIWRKCCGILDHYSVKLKRDNRPAWKRKTER